jgi:hypothetical protein
MAKQFDVKALRQKALDSDDVKYDSIYIAEWDAELPVRTLTTPAIKKLMKQKDDEVRMMILAVLYGCVTQEGESVFEENDLAVFESDKKSFSPITKLGTKIMEISGLNDQAKVAAKNE